MTDPTSEDAKVAALRQEIAQTRSELGDTVEALAARADVKARTQEKVEETKARVGVVVADAKDEARARAKYLAEAARQLAREFQADPGATARRVAEQAQTSARDNPRQWAVAGAALLAFALLLVRRRTGRGRRLDRRWRKQL